MQTMLVRVEEMAVRGGEIAKCLLEVRTTLLHASLLDAKRLHNAVHDLAEVTSAHVLSAPRAQLTKHQLHLAPRPSEVMLLDIIGEVKELVIKVHAVHDDTRC